MGASEERDAKIAGHNLAIGYLRGYIAARADGNRAHVEENIEVVRALLADDLAADNENAGALTRAFLTGFGEVAQILCQYIMGDDGFEQGKVLELAIISFGGRINEASDE